MAIWALKEKYKAIGAKLINYEKLKWWFWILLLLSPLLVSIWTARYCHKKRLVAQKTGKRDTWDVEQKEDQSSKGDASNKVGSQNAKSGYQQAYSIDGTPGIKQYTQNDAVSNICSPYTNINSHKPNVDGSKESKNRLGPLEITQDDKKRLNNFGNQGIKSTEIYSSSLKGLDFHSSTNNKICTDENENSNVRNQSIFENYMNYHYSSNQTQKTNQSLGEIEKRTSN